MKCLLTTLVAACGVSLVISAGAGAEIRTATITDPEDAIPPISGDPNNPDVSQVDVLYDSTAGSIALTVGFYNSLHVLDMSENYSIYAYFNVGSNCYASDFQGIEGQHHVRSLYTQFYDRATVTGYSGYLEFDRVEAQDGRSITISASAPGLIDQDFRCLSYRLLGRARNSPSNPYSRYDADCGCWYLNQLLDDVADKAWFEGFAPEDQPKVETRYTVNPRSRCYGLDLSHWELLPEQVYGEERSFGGELVFRLRGHGSSKTLRTRVRDVIRWKDLRDGRYRLETHYSGDEWRQRSETLEKQVKVGC